MNVRSKWFMVVIQSVDILNDHYITDDEIIDYASQEAINYYAFIKHDLDTNKDGTLKTEHYHLLINTYNDYCSSTIINDIAKRLKCNKDIVSCRVCKDVKASTRYLLHLDNDDKVYYHIEDLIDSNHEMTLMLMDKGDCSNIDFAGLLEICRDAESLSEVYSKLPLKLSCRYRNVINDVFKDTQELRKRKG